MLGAALSIASVRFVFTFNLNAWLETRQANKQKRDQETAIQQCSHAWNLHPLSPYSVCVKCYVLIPTSILRLNRAAEVPGLMIISEDWHNNITATGGALTTTNAIGNVGD